MKSAPHISFIFSPPPIASLSWSVLYNKFASEDCNRRTCDLLIFTCATSERSELVLGASPAYLNPSRATSKKRHTIATRTNAEEKGCDGNEPFLWAKVGVYFGADFGYRLAEKVPEAGAWHEHGKPQRLSASGELHSVLSVCARESKASLGLRRL